MSAEDLRLLTPAELRGRARPPRRRGGAPRRGRRVPPPAPSPVAGGAPAPVPLAGGEPLWMLDHEELPDSYGVDEIHAMAKDPWHLFVYWEVTPDGRAAARSQLAEEAHAATLVLRVVDVSVTEAGVVESTRDVAVDWDHGRRYIDAPHPGGTV